jgi:hypothetical protein
MKAQTLIISQVHPLSHASQKISPARKSAVIGKDARLSIPSMECINFPRVC